MKKGLLLLSLFALVSGLMQAQGFNYQTVLRGSGGEVLSNESVAVTFEILQGNESGPIVYSEEYAGASSNTYGVLSLIVGEGSPIVGTFADIDWANGPFYLRVTLGSDVMGASKLNAVPYASYADMAGSVDSAKKADSASVALKADVAKLANKASDLEISDAAAGDLLYFDGANWVKLDKGNDDQVLTLKAGVPVWEDASAGAGSTEPKLGEAFSGGIICAIYPDGDVLVVKDEVIEDAGFEVVMDYPTAEASVPVGFRLPNHQEIDVIKANSIYLSSVWVMSATFWTSTAYVTDANYNYTLVVGTGVFNTGGNDYFAGGARVLAVKKVPYSED